MDCTMDYFSKMVHPPHLLMSKQGNMGRAEQHDDG